jgi:hypothetical protein
VAWVRLRHRLADAEIVWSDARTPRQAAAVVAAENESRCSRPMTPAARAALTDLARAVEGDRYAMARPTWQPGELQERVATVVRAAGRT